MAITSHVKGPEKEGKREASYYASRVEYVEGLDGDSLNSVMTPATDDNLGVVKTGANITNVGGTISITKENVTNALGYTPQNVNTTATSNQFGSVKTGANITNTNGTISITKENVTNALGYTPLSQSVSYGTATETKAGIVKLYDDFGDNVDGAMSQIAVKNKTVPRPIPTVFTIAQSAWSRNSSETSSFIYYADINVAGVTANDYAEINFNRVSQNIVARASLCPSGETMNGKIRLFAKDVPDSAISGEYIVTKGAV